MQDTHDERRIPFDPEPLPAREGYFFRLMAKLGLREKKQRDERIQKAAEANRPLREAQMRRAVAQPGTPPDVVEKFSRVLARLGKGEGFACVAVLPVICLACLAILCAVAVVL